MSGVPGIMGKVLRHYRSNHSFVRMVDIQWSNGKVSSYALTDVNFEKLLRQCPHCGAYHACTLLDRNDYPIPPTCASCGKAH